jgi:multidrug efflux pump subunit AcrB
VILNLADRTLNVISLAGLAFAVGMVLDAAIVVLENIVRLREEGQSAFESSLRGSSQVWGALVASTATTVAIFLPVIFLKDVEGQLFADLALTIAIAVSISLLVAVTILPSAARRWLREETLEDSHSAVWGRIASSVTRLTDRPKRRLLLIVLLMSVPVTATLLLIPKLDYLPPVKRDAVDAFFNFPPGSNVDTIKGEIVDVMVDRLRPYMSGEKEPALKNYYVMVWPGGGTIGVRAKDQSRVKELEEIVRNEVTAGFPDTRAFVFQGNLFGGFGGNRNIAVHMQSSDVEALLDTARQGMGWIQEAIPGSQVQADPGTELAEPELLLHPNDRRVLEVGWTRGQVGSVVRAVGNGLFVGEHFDGEQRMDIILKTDGWSNPEELASIPVATPQGGVVQLGELVSIERTVGPSQLRRIDRRRTVTLNVSPPQGLSLEEALTTLQEDIEPRLRETLPADGGIIYGGSADSLRAAVKNMTENFLIALMVLFLLMSALFGSMRDSLLVVLALPLATVGGVVALRILNLITFQPLDLLTMIGFIILLGLVVNNAILLVHQTRSAERDGAERREAVNQALRLRVRPIFMTTLTSIFGMLPLVLMPGAGSAIYRGLATVIVGGMSVSTLFTLLLLPSLLRLGEKANVRHIPRYMDSDEPVDLRRAS